MTTERKALDRLLALFPEWDLIEVDWATQHGSPWLAVWLGQRSEDNGEAWAVHHYVIWKRTGAVYLIGADGAVIDPPFIEGETG